MFTSLRRGCEGERLPSQPWPCDWLFQAVAVPYDQLPVELPPIDKLTGRGPSPLAQQHDWINTTCPKWALRRATCSCGPSVDWRWDSPHGYLISDCFELANSSSLCYCGAVHWTGFQGISYCKGTPTHTHTCMCANTRTNMCTHACTHTHTHT